MTDPAEDSDRMTREAAFSAMYGEIDPYEGEMWDAINAMRQEQAAQDTERLAGLDRRLVIAMFADKSALNYRHEHLTFRELAVRTGNTNAASKFSLPMLKLARFGNKRTDKGCARFDDNVLAVSGIEADYDAGKVSIDETVALLRNGHVAGMVYSSPSHSEDVPRWRVLCPLSTDYEPADRARFLARLNGILGGVLSRESFTLSQSYYFGKVNNNPSHQVVLVEGDYLDLRDDLDESAIGRPVKGAASERPVSTGPFEPVSDKRMQGLLNKLLDNLRRQAVDGAKHHALRDCARTLGGYAWQMGLSDDQAVQMLLGCLPDSVEDWRAARNTALWGVAKGRENPLAIEDRPFQQANGHGAHIDLHNFRVNGTRVYQNADADADAGQSQDAPKPEAEQSDDPDKQWAYWTELGWPDPLDFLADPELTGAPELLPEHVPEAISKFAFDVAGRLGCDPAAMALCQIVSVASVIPDTWKIQPKQYDDTYTQSARIWGLILGPPSTMKSPLIAMASGPVDHLEIMARERHVEAMLSYRVRHKAWKDAGSDPADEPRKPLLDRYLVEGATLEAISEILREDDRATMRAPSRKLLVRQDELSEWLATMDQYKSGGTGGADRGAYLRMFNGGRYTVDRIARGSFPISNWSGCILGGIQPEPIQKIAGKAADDGLLQRFLYIVPSGNRRGEDRRPDAEAAERYAGLFPTLSAMRPASGRGGLTDGRVVLSAEAHERRREMEDVVEALAAMPDISKRLKSSFEKWNGIWARITLAFHLIECADAKNTDSERCVDVVDGGVATMSTKFMRDVLLPHLMRAEATMFATEQTGHARWIAGFILSRTEDLKARDRIAARDIMRAYRAMKAPEQKKQVLDIMDTLEKMGWLLRVEKDRRPTDVAVVNPKVFIRFGEQARREKENRDATKKRIQETLKKHRVSLFGNLSR